MRPITAIIDLRALRHNYGVAQELACGVETLAVIKANAYGHGVERAAHALAHADGYAVVELEAAVRLRDAGVRQRIVLLEGFFDARELEAFIEHKLTSVIHCTEQIQMLRALKSDAALDVFIKLDTGMKRLGFDAENFASVLSRIRNITGVGAITVMSHFASADDARGIAWQLERFERAVGAESLPRSLANSAAILRYRESHADMVRPGIMLYGCSPFAESVGAELGLQPVMTLTSEIIAVRELAAGDTVGYGGAFTAPSAMRIGVVACGYADGYPRHAPTGTPISVGSTRTRTVGRVSMDMLCVDLSGVAEARVGTPVVLWGAANPIENVAAAAGTVGYELMCALAPRVRVIEKS
jgi:alanine racemase